MRYVGCGGRLPIAEGYRAVDSVVEQRQWPAQTIGVGGLQVLAWGDHDANGIAGAVSSNAVVYAQRLGRLDQLEHELMSIRQCSPTI